MIDRAGIIEELREIFPEVDQHLRKLEKDLVVAHTCNVVIRAPEGDLTRAQTKYMLVWRKEEGSYYTSVCNLTGGYIRALQRDNKNNNKIVQTPFEKPVDNWTRQMVLEATGYIEHAKKRDRFYLLVENLDHILSIREIGDQL
jgi:hypothetical protein